MINPEKRADILRKTLIKNGEYLIAQIGGQGQSHKERKILDVYFRYKDYLKPEQNPNWFKAPLKEVWSSKFLGLKKNFFNLPVEKIKKLEFQNPSYSAAFRFLGKKGDPRKYAKVFTVQVAGCNFDCNFCYVPAQLRSGIKKFGKYFSAEEIVDHFLKIKKERKNEEWNVLRISGGESLTIVPEIILDIQKEIEKRSPRTYIWIDTNLSNSKYIKKFEKELKNVLQKKNVGIVGCFKGVDKKDFSILTGLEEKFYENQFEVAKILINWNTDIYFYLPSLIYKNNIEKKIEDFIKKLQKIHKDLPLRIEVIPIIGYLAAEINIQEKTEQGRPLPEISQGVFFDLWHNKVLPKFYSKKQLQKYCCEINLTEG